MRSWFSVLRRFISFCRSAPGPRHFFLVPALLMLLLMTPAAAALSSDLPSISDIQNQLDMLNKQKNLTSGEQLSQQDLTRTLELLDAIDRVKQQSSQLQQRVAQVPEKLQAAIDGIEKLNGSDSATRQSFASLPLRQLESQLNDTLNNLQSAQEELATYNSQLIALQTQPERVQSTMLTLSQQLQQVRNQLNDMEPGQQPLRPSQQLMLIANQYLLNAELDLQRKNLEVNTSLQDLLQKQLDYTNVYINQLEHRVQLLQEVANSKRLTLSEETVKQVQSQSPEDGDDIQNDPLVSRELAVNRQLGQRLIAVTEEVNALVQQNVRVSNWLDRVLQSERNLKEQVTVLRGTLLLSRILYQQQQSFPTNGLMTNLPTRIADMRLEQFEINQQRDELFQGNDYIQKLIGDDKTGVSSDVQDALEQIVAMRRELLDQLNKQLGNQLSQAINLQINQQQLLSVSDSVQRTLTQQIFWVISNKPMNWPWLKALPGVLKQQFSSFHPKLQPDALLTGMLNSLAVLLPMLLIIGLLRWRMKGIDRRLGVLAKDVGQLKRDSQLHTPEALFLTLLKVLPGVLLILGVGFWCLRSALSISDFLWSLSQQLALFWLVIGLLWNSVLPGGIAACHFSIAPARCAHYRRQTVRLGLTLLPLIFWSTLGSKRPLSLVDDVIGQVVILLTLIVLGVQVFPICRNSWREKNTHAVRLVMVTAMAVMPVMLIGLMMAGYFYTALRLAGRWIDSLYLLIAWHLVYLIAIRGLSVAARRLAYRRALARRQNMAKEGAEGNEPVVEEPSLAIDQINQQSLRLTTMLLFLIFSSLLYWIWADLITVISYLDSIILWHYNATVAGSSVQQAVTLGNLMISLLALAVMYVMMRNLPGLLEVLVLSRMQLRQGTSYAITTILSYLIAVVGAMIALGSLGVSWDKLQWLAAALSVGLGFGLQEIFANFVSGLIILFERPIRIGDTITIGNYSGSVSKIRIRATTITDFDRKEVIVPNKAFVTEQLINWSLSDTVTRVLIKVGVAYGSDLDQVKSVLLKAAKENPRVMTDPEPQVFFLNFGASTLDHELRFYVRELRDRSHTVDELNRTIDRLCRENNINIAFNQLEVYLHNQQGREVQEVSRPLKPPANDPQGA